MDFSARYLNLSWVGSLRMDQPAAWGTKRSAGCNCYNIPKIRPARMYAICSTNSLKNDIMSWWCRFGCHLRAENPLQSDLFHADNSRPRYHSICTYKTYERVQWAKESANITNLGRSFFEAVLHISHTYAVSIQLSSQYLTEVIICYRYSPLCLCSDVKYAIALHWHTKAKWTRKRISIIGGCNSCRQLLKWPEQHRAAKAPSRATGPETLFQIVERHNKRSSAWGKLYPLNEAIFNGLRPRLSRLPVRLFPFVVTVGDCWVARGGTERQSMVEHCHSVLKVFRDGQLEKNSLTKVFFWGLWGHWHAIIVLKRLPHSGWTYVSSANDKVRVEKERRVCVNEAVPSWPLEVNKIFRKENVLPQQAEE